MTNIPIKHNFESVVAKLTPEERTYLANQICDAEGVVNLRGTRALAHHLRGTHIPKAKLKKLKDTAKKPVVASAPSRL